MVRDACFSGRGRHAIGVCFRSLFLFKGLGGSVGWGGPPEAAVLATSSSIVAQIAGRYAAALFDLAKEQGGLDVVAGDLDRLSAMITESADLRRLMRSPLIRRDEQGRALGALAAAVGLGPVVSNLLQLLARNGRLFTLSAVIAAFRTRLAAERGEQTAQVTSAEPLSDGQLAKLKSELSRLLGADVNIDSSVDGSLLGGLVVRLGSRQIDGSLKTKLDRLAVAMKGNG